MGLNFLGLGFSFGAKDSGLEEKQKSILSNFEAMSARMVELGQAADKASVGDVATPGQVDQINKMSEAMGGLEEHLGTELPEASRKGTEQFHRDSSQMESDQRKIGGGFNFIRDAMEKLDTIARQNKLQTFIQAISLSQLKGIGDQLGNIATSGRNLTTSLEAEMTSLSKSTRATGANFGYTGKALSKFSGKAAGMAKSLNIDANTAALALRGWHEAGSELAAMGFKSAKEVAKFSAAFGVSADVLRNSGLRMRKEFKMGDKEINTVVGSFTKMGQITGDVTGAMNEMPKMMDLLRRRAAAMGKELDPKELAKYAASTAGLAAGFMQMGQSSDQARASAMQISETLIKSKENFSDMFGGTADDLTEFDKALGIGTGSIENSFKAMKQGPSEFMAGMADMVQQAQASGKKIDFKILDAQMRKVFGDDKGAEMALFFRNADKATLDLMKTVGKTPAQLGKLGKDAHRTGRTLAESFELAKDSFVASFRSISKKEAVAFVKDTSSQFNIFNQKLRDIAAGDGPMSSVVKKFSEMHQIGAMALLPKALRPMAAVFGEMAAEITPLVGALGALGFRFNMLLNPLVLLTAASVGLFALYKGNQGEIEQASVGWGKQEKALGKLHKKLGRTRKNSEQYYRILEKINKIEEKRPAKRHIELSKAYQKQTKSIRSLRNQLTKYGKNSEKWKKTTAQIEQAEKQLAKTRSAISKEARAKTINDVKVGVQKAVQKIGLVGEALLGLVKEWWPAVKDFVRGFWDALISGVDPAGDGKSPAAQWGLKFGAAIRHGLSVAVGAIKSYLKKWWANMVGIWTDPSKSFTEKVKETMTGSAGIILAAFALAKFTPVFGVLSTLTGLFGKLGLALVTLPAKMPAIIAGIKGFLGGIKAVLAPIFTLKALVIGVVAALAVLTVGFLAFPEKTKKFVKKVGGAIRAVFEKLGYWLTEGIILLVKAVQKVVSKLPEIMYSWLPKAASALKKAMNSLIDWIFSAIEGLLTGIETRLVEAFPEYAETIRTTFMVIKGIFYALAETIKVVLGGAVDVLVSIFQNVYEALRSLANAAIAAVKVVAAPFVGLYNFFKQLIGGIIKLFSDPWEGIRMIITAPIELVKAAWWGIKNFFIMLWEGVKAITYTIWAVIKGILFWPISLVKAAWNATKDFFAGLWDGIKNIASKIWGGIKDIVLLPVTVIKKIWGGIKDFFSGLWDGIKSAAGFVWDKIKGIVLAPVRLIKKAWGKVKGFFGGIWNGIKSVASKAWNGIKGAASSAWNWITGGSSSAKEVIKVDMEEIRKEAEKAEAKASAAAKGMSDEVQKHIESNTDLTKFETMKAGGYYKGMTKTTSGHIIRAGQAITKYVKDAHGQVKMLVMEANKMNVQKIQGLGDMDEHTKKIRAMRKERDRLVKGGHDKKMSKEWMAYIDKRGAALGAFRRQFGMDLDMVAGNIVNIENAMSVSNDRMKELRASGFKNAQHFADARQKYMKTVADQLITLEKNRGSMTKAEYKKQYKGLQDQVATFNGFQAQQIDIATGKWSEHFDKLKAGSTEANDFLKLVARTNANTWESSTAEITKSLEGTSQKTRDLAQKTIADLKMAMEGEILAIQNTAGLSADDIQKKIDKITTNYDAVAQKMRATIVAETANLNQGLEENTTVALGKIGEQYKGLAEKGSAATEKMKGEVQKLGFTGENAKDMMSEIANINTKTFKKNLKVIKEEFLGLLEKLGEIQKGLIDLGPTSTDAFKAAQVALATFWKDFDKQFASSKNIAAIASTAFGKIEKAAKTLKINLKRIVGDMWIDVLNMTDTAIKAIEADSKRVVSQLKAIARASYAASKAKDTESKEDMKNRIPGKTFKAAESHDAQLYAATHWPDWYVQSFEPMARAIRDNTAAFGNSSSGETPGVGGRTASNSAIRSVKGSRRE